ncbi:MAG TPA: membrane protein insertase YidC [Gemmatimonadaceae bacterium]|nr:membrane protein insertase YidC [Gemmatimonadaceae bacterium]
MDKRFFLFLALAAAILVITPKLFPPAHVPQVQSDSTRQRTARESTTTASKPAPSAATTAPSAAAAPARSPDTLASVAAARADTVVVNTPKVTYRFSTVGAMPIGNTLRDFKALTKGDGRVDLARPGVPLLEYRLVVGGRDTIPLYRLPFTVDSSAAAGATKTLRFHTTAAGTGVTIAYTFSPDGYLVHVHGTVEGGGAQPRQLLVDLPQGLRSQEADTLDDQRHFAFVTKPLHDGAESAPFGKLELGKPRIQSGPLSWAASKTKYFVVSLFADTTIAPFSGVVMRALPRTSEKLQTNASATVIQPIAPNGAFGFDLYAGPQEWRRLLALGRGFENVNPYGGFFRPIVQPFSTVIMRVLLWMHDHLRINYGWVLVIFGVAVRLILWPLNQGAMRSSLKLQRIQPELQAIQKKYKNNLEKQQAEMMRLYKEHGMSPFSPLAGCLPMLIPMPVLFALYFVFLNTIEFRGVSFLWMADISLKDPYYILPVAMGISMFVLSWIGLRTSPQNAQAKMMAYVFPVMMTVFFLNLPAGLNLYYAVQNIAALPQQWLIAKERAKSAPAPVREVAATKGG